MIGRQVLLALLAIAAVADSRPSQAVSTTTTATSETSVVPPSEIAEPTSTNVDTEAVEKVFDTGVELTNKIFSGGAGTIDLVALQDNTKQLADSSKKFVVSTINSFNTLSKTGADGEVTGKDRVESAIAAVKDLSGSTIGFLKEVSGPGGELALEFLTLGGNLVKNVAPFLENLPAPGEIKIPNFSDFKIPEVKIPNFSDFKIPDVNIPNFSDFKIPEVKISDVNIPNFSDFKIPEVKIPNFSDFKIPEVKIPEVKIPDVKIPDFQIPSVDVIEVKIPEIRVPEVKLFTSNIEVPFVTVGSPAPTPNYRRAKSSRETSRGRRYKD